MAMAKTTTSRRDRAARPGRSERRERRERRESRLVLGVPARFMVPRLVFLGTATLLTAFGLMMIYSASSITALTQMGDAAYYLKRQAFFAALGIALALVIAKFDYHLWARRVLVVIWAVTVGLLVLVLTPVAGSDAYGASRWVSIGPFTLQPSEFAKITLILVAANLLSDVYEENERSNGQNVAMFILGIVVPAGLIIIQPDKGTVAVVAATLVLMLYFAGASGKLCVGILVLGVALLAGISFIQPYSRARILTMLDPWSDRYGQGYQLVQGIYAFASGGIFGVGVGMSKQKYSYLPMAYNDFIYAVIGEELGLVGAVGMLVAFAVLLWAGLKIARYAPDLCGQLVAVGCTSILVIQMLLNVTGVLGLFPLSGKPIPFVSYGGSSIMSSIMLAGMVTSVSLRSKLPTTDYDARRSDLSVTSAPRGGGWGEESGAGEATPRSARTSGAGTPTSQRFTVVAGGRGTGPREGSRSTGRRGTAREDREDESPTSPEALRREREMRARANGARLTYDSNGRRRIDLGPSASDRLRKRNSGPEVRGADSSRRGGGSGRRGR